MGYIIGLSVVFLLAMAIHYFTEFDTKQKLTVASVLSIIICSAIYYNQIQNQNMQHMREVVLRFNQGKNIQCNKLDVNSSNYTLSIGTYTFIGKKNTPNFEQMISVSNCK